MRRERLALIAIAGLVAALLAALLYHGGPDASWLPGCLFHRLTGMSCPGCGMTRATHAALHGDWLQAFRFNPVGVIAFPAIGAAIGLEIFGWLRGKPLPRGLRVGPRTAWALFGVLLAFWVLRNIPSWPFTLLAPP